MSLKLSTEELKTLLLTEDPEVLDVERAAFERLQKSSQSRRSSLQLTSLDKLVHISQLKKSNSFTNKSQIGTQKKQGFVRTCSEPTQLNTSEAASLEHWLNVF
eukprot:748726-Hanusia_phi.AAC.3